MTATGKEHSWPLHLLASVPIDELDWLSLMMTHLPVCIAHPLHGFLEQPTTEAWGSHLPGFASQPLSWAARAEVPGENGPTLTA